MVTYALTQDRDLHVHAVAANDLTPIALLVTGPDGNPARHEGEPQAASWDFRHVAAGTVLTTDPEDARLIVHDLLTMDVIFSG